MKKIIIEKKLFLIQGLFYITQVNNKLYFVHETNHYRIYKFSIEKSDFFDNSKNRKYIRIWTTKFNTIVNDTHFQQSIRILFDSNKTYRSCLYEANMPYDFYLTGYAISKLHKFLKAHKVKKIYLNNLI